MSWYNEAIFYHIYPLGLCGCAKENTGIAESHFDQLKEWAEHAAKLNCTAIYIGPLFESVGHGYETVSLIMSDESSLHLRMCSKIESSLHIAVGFVT